MGLMGLKDLNQIEEAQQGTTTAGNHGCQLFRCREKYISFRFREICREKCLCWFVKLRDIRVAFQLDRVVRCCE